MGEFSKGWRRKIGCVTLLLSLAFMGGWMRSVVIEDSLTAQCEGLVMIFIGSKNQGLIWAKLQETIGPQHPRFARHPQGWASRTNAIGPFDGIDGYSTQQRWRFCGFRFEEGELLSPARIGLTIRIIPYWSVVFPLTLISLWLFLSSPANRLRRTTMNPHQTMELESWARS